MAFSSAACGLCTAGCYTIIEAWMQAKVTNETRGRAMGVYPVVDIMGSLGAQLIIGVLEPGSYISYNLLALLLCSAGVPADAVEGRSAGNTGCAAPAPATGMAALALGCGGGHRVGRDGGGVSLRGADVWSGGRPVSNQIAIYLAAYVVGGAVAQYPVGWAADKYDRRKVLLVLSAIATLTCGAAILLSDLGPWVNYATIAAFGFATMPIYSVSTAHAHDYASSLERVELSAALMFLYAVGAIASPYVASLLIEGFGAAAMFVMIAVAHVLLIIFGLARMGARTSPSNVTAYTYEPRTSFIIGRLLGWVRDRH